MFSASKWFTIIKAGFLFSLFFLALPANAKLSDAELIKVEALLERVVALKHLEIANVLEQLKEQAKTTKDPIFRAELYQRGLQYAVALDQEDLIRNFANLLAHQAELNGNSSQLMIARLDLIYADALAGQMEESGEKLKQAFEATTSKELEDVRVHATILLGLIGANLGQNYEHIQNLKAIKELIPRSAQGDAERMLLHVSLAYLSLEIKSLDEVITNYTISLDIAELNNLGVDRDTMLYNVAFSLLGHQHAEKSRAYFNELLKMADESGVEENKFFAWYGLALAWYSDGNYEKSHEAADIALNNFDGPMRFNLKLLQHQAINLTRLGNVGAAKQLLEDVVALQKKFPYLASPEVNSQQKKANGEILIAEGNFSEGMHLIDQYHQENLTLMRDRVNRDVLFLRSHHAASLNEEKAKQSLTVAQVKLQQQTLYASLAFATLLMVAIVMQVKNSRALKVSTLQARRANKAKSEFLAVMSHELRTPLNAVIGFSDIMKNETSGPLGNPQYKEYVNVIHESGSHLLHIINDILDLAKIESGHVEINDSHVDLKRQIEETMRLMSARAKARHITLTKDISVTLPEVNTDDRLMKQMLLNLASNAVKFTPDGGSVGFIANQMADETIQIEIVDSGIGMDPKDITRALRPFEQVQSAFTRNQQGTGLGLPLVKSQIELMGGTLDILSKLGEGTRAILTLPAERIISPEDNPDSEMWI